MKIIVSHDVDHLYLKDHLADTYIPGVFLKGFRAMLRENISMKQFAKRFSFKLNNVKELHQFNKQYRVKETFFFGMRTGLNLSYNWQQAKPFIQYLLDENVLIGLHGMGYESSELLKEEAMRLKTMLPENYSLGIRNHYLRKNDDTFRIINDAGFAFDSTEYKIALPYKDSDLWEIPISIMDAGFISPTANDLNAIKQKTLEIFEQAIAERLPFFVINFHDVYFSDAYPDNRNWYTWLIEYLHANKFEFIDFSEAIKFLNIAVAEKTASS